VRIFVIRRNWAEAVSFVEAYGFAHFWRKCVEPHFFVTDPAGFSDYSFDGVNTDLLAAQLVAKNSLFISQMPSSSF